MTITIGTTKYMHDDSIYEYYNAEVKAKAIGYGDGREDGLAEGRRDEKIEIAKSMLDKKYDIHEITGLTGLSIEEINKLQAQAV